MPLRPSALPAPPPTPLSAPGTRPPRRQLLRFSSLSACMHTSGAAMFHLLLRPGPPPAAAAAAPPPYPPPPGRPALCQPAPQLALRATAGSSAKDVGGSPEKAGFSFHTGISSVSLGISYLALSSSVDMTAVLFKFGFSESLLQSKRAADTGTFVLAYAIHKLFAPVRLSITTVSVPFIVQYCSIARAKTKP
uniref:DUF1279 domain-containing protein n=1 Tax=Anas platyrhynchos TaxID=8839 RepID=A0A8B9ZFN1_ANAPL